MVEFKFEIIVKFNELYLIRFFDVLGNMLLFYVDLF